MTAVAPAPRPTAGEVDLDLRGLLRVRLVDADTEDRRAVERQLGLPADGATTDPGRRVPILRIRYVDDVLAGAILHPLGAREHGFTDPDGDFVLLRTFGKVPTCVRVPLDRLGADDVELVVQRGTPGIPLLLPIINLLLLEHGIVALHAAAVRVRGRGVLITGWSKGGKTELLLGLAEQGAQYVGDEWVYIDPARGRMLGLPEPMRVWDWHLEQRPDLRRRLPSGVRARLRATAIAAGGPSHATPSLRLPSGLRRAQALARRQLSVRLPPEEVFGPGGTCADAPIDRVVLVVTRDDPAVTVSEIHGAEVADRMVASLEQERADLLEADRAYRYAFPGRGNPRLATASARERTLLHQALSSVPARRLDHPSPVSFRALADAVLDDLAASG